MMKRLLFLILTSVAVVTQGSYSTVASIKSPGNLARLIPNAPVVVCQFPGTGGVHVIGRLEGLRRESTGDRSRLLIGGYAQDEIDVSSKVTRLLPLAARSHIAVDFG